MTKRIAILGDDPDLVAMLQEVVQEAGYETVSTCHDAACEALIAQTHPDLLVFDMRMGQRTSGWDVLKQLRQRSPTDALPIILLSADHVSREELAPQLRRYACAVVPKPFALDTFLQAIATALATADDPPPA